MKKYPGVVEVLDDLYASMIVYVEDDIDMPLKVHIIAGTGYNTMAEAMEKARKHLKED